MDFEKLKRKLADRPIEGPENVESNPGDTFDFEEVLFQEDQFDSRISRSQSARKILGVFSWIGPALVLLAPIPFGSNRPVIWMIWCIVLFLALAIFTAAVAARDPGRSIRVASLRRLLIVGALVPLGAAIQSLPLNILNAAPEYVAEYLIPDTISLSPQATLMGALRYLSYLALFVIVVATSTRADMVSNRLSAIFYAVLINAVIGLVMLTVLGDVTILGEKESYQGFATGGFVNRNSFATFLGMGLVCGFALLLDRANKPRRRRHAKPSLLSPENVETLLFVFCLGIVFIALTLTASRAGMGSTLAGLWFVYILMSAKSHGSILPALGRGAIALAGLAVLSLLTIGEDLFTRSLFVENDSANRFDLYKQVASMIAMRPLSGFGLDNFRIAFELFHTLPVSRGLTWSLAHSTYLALWAELGLVFGSLPMIAVALVFWRTFKSYRDRSSGFVAPVATMGCILLGALHSLVDFSLEMEANVFLLIAIAGLGVSTLRQSAQPKVTAE